MRLEGRLAGPWVREAESCWQTMHSTSGDRALIVDLRDVDFVDSAGEQLLSMMHHEGARLMAASPMMAHLVGEIAGLSEEMTDTAGVNVKRGAAVPLCYRKKK